jgi:hypothetical protein
VKKLCVNKKHQINLKSQCKKHLQTLLEPIVVLKKYETEATLDSVGLFPKELQNSTLFNELALMVILPDGS